MTESTSDQATTPAPRDTAVLFGHEAAERHLLEACRSGRLHHAWLIAGPRGVGKATLAFRFARWLLAGAGDDGTDPDSMALDPDHPVFRRTASGGHADLLAVEPGQDEKTGRMREEIVVDDVRAIGAFLHLTPGEGGWRVVIIDSADAMNRNAANAVLKLLEEPPRRTLLLLISHSPGRLLPTLRSRCRTLTLRGLAGADLDRALAALGREVPAAELAALEQFASGSVGRAVALLDGGGLELYRELVALLSGLLEPRPRIEPAAAHDFCERLARPQAAESHRLAKELFAWWLARLVRAGALGRAPEDMVRGEGELISRLAGDLAPARRLDLWQGIGERFARAEGANLDRKQTLLGAFLAIERAVRA